MCIQKKTKHELDSRNGPAGRGRVLTLLHCIAINNAQQNMSIVR